MRLFAALIFVFAAPIVQAQEDPRVVMEGFLDELKTFWVPLNTNAAASYASRRAWTRDLVRNRFDFGHMVRSSMGIRWNQMSAAQQATYTDLFFDALVETTIDWFDAYDGEVFEIRNIRQTGRNTEVRTRFFYSNGRALNATWTTRLIDGKYLFRDIRVAGLSLMADFRGKYAQIIDREGFDGFFEKLEVDTARLRAKQS